jgi:hypothetical protein
MARFQNTAPKHHAGRPFHSICKKNQIELLEATAAYLRADAVMAPKNLKVAKFDELPNGDFRALIYSEYELRKIAEESTPV